MLILQEWTGDVLGLNLSGPSSRFVNGKLKSSPGAIGFAHVNDWFGTYPNILYKKHKNRFYIEDSYVIENNQTNFIIYRICLIKDKEHMKNLVEKISKSSRSPKTLILANDSNYKILLVADIDGSENEPMYKNLAKEACDFVLEFIKYQPDKVVIR